MPQQARFFIVLTDLYTKWPEVKPVSTVTSHSVIEFLSDMFSRWGLPEEIISDNGKQFVSQEFEQFLTSHGIKHCKTALYHPQSNGAVERFNRVLKERLRAGRTQDQSYLSTLRAILFEYRNNVQATIGTSPAHLMIGRRLRGPLDVVSRKPLKKRVSFDPEPRVLGKQQAMKMQFDKRKKPKPIRYFAGDTVRVRIPNPRSKLDPAWSSPKQISRMVTPFTAQLADGTKWNISRLRLHSRASDELDEDLWDAIPVDPIQHPPEQVADVPRHDPPVDEAVLNDQLPERHELQEEPANPPPIARPVLPQRNRRPPQLWRDYYAH